MRQERTSHAGRTFIGLLLATVVLSTSGCSKLVVDIAEPELPPDVFGGWVWSETLRIEDGVTETPETQGFSLTLNISEPNAFELLRDSELESSGTIRFVPGNGSQPAQFLYSALMLGAAGHFVEFNAQGDLVLTDTCCGGIRYTFRRL